MKRASKEVWKTVRWDRYATIRKGIYERMCFKKFCRDNKSKREKKIKL